MMLRDDLPLVAVVGAGYWGKNLVRNFYHLGVLKTVFDERPAAAAAQTAEFPGLEAARSLADILGDEAVAGVAIAAPATAHFRLARQCLMAGKHVFVEKPLTLDPQEGRQLADLADEKRLTLMVDHILQNHPAYVRLRELAESGALGRIRHVISRRRSLGQIRLEENALWEFAPHDVSMVLGLTGAMPVKAAATGGSWVTPGLEDTVEGHLAFPGGARADISVGWLNPYKEQTLIVVGSEKMAVFDDTAPWPEKLKLYAHKIEWPGQRPVPAKAPAEAVELREAEPLKAQCLDFINAMNGGKKPASDGREGVRVLTVLEALARSLAGGGAPVDVLAAPRPYFLHPTSVVDAGASVGAGTKIWHFSHVLKGSRIGEGCNLGQNVVVGPNVTIGRGVKVQNNVSVYDGVTLEDDVFCGPSMVFTNVINPRANIIRKSEFKPTLVKRGATIGANVTVLCGHTLGAWCFISAGAVVTRNVPDHALMSGNPARQRGWVCRCGAKLGEDFVCPACGLAYRMSEKGLALKGE